MKRYQDEENWKRMTPLKEYHGTEIRIEPTTGRFAGWIGDRLRALKDMRALEREILSTRRAIRAVPVSLSSSALADPPRIDDLVGHEDGRWRLNNGQLTGHYRDYVHSTDDLVAQLTTLHAQYRALRAEFDAGAAALLEQYKALIKAARPVTPADLTAARSAPETPEGQS
jgi:hypothetical protein